MKNDNKMKPEKKGFPGGFLLIIFAIVIIVMATQSLLNNKATNISFSHQLEHLVNLDLIKPESNIKIAQNDNLVTFSGKFRDHETEEGKKKIKYLEYLNQNHELTREKNKLQADLSTLQKSVYESGDWFFHLSGFKLPENGYTIISRIYDTPERENSVIIKELSDKAFVSLTDLENRLSLFSDNKEFFKADFLTLIRLYRSPNLGIGDEQLKQRLRTLEKKIQNQFSLQTSTEGLNELRAISGELMVEKDGVSLIPLRSVRNYLETIDQFNSVESQLAKNETLLQKTRQSVVNVTWFFNNKELSTRALEEQDFETYSHWFSQAKSEWKNFSQNRSLMFKSPDQPRNTVLEKKFKSQEPSPNYFSYLFTILPIAVLVLLVYFIFSRQMKGMGSSAMNFGKSPARLLTKETNHTTFKDVAGADEAKEELEEIVDFLKDPQKFTALGARIPKGVLLVGPPGTGKTLVAKAVAGEADRPFFSISGSDFVEMFVGVGASRIRDLFDQAKKNAPCIIFMDEIDAVGRHRGAGIGGGHDEREQTLNQLLVEMDGFDTKEGIILMAATNRPDILDKALLRPGRFDRRVVLDLPDVKGRHEILKVHARRIKIDPSVELMDVAKNTPGSSGADLENILNEAALLAARHGRTAVTQQEVIEATDKVRFGKERKSLEMDVEEKKTTAYHESGHAIVGLSVKHADPVDKVTIIPRGFSLGATHFMPKKNRLSYWRKEIIDQLAILMGGRAAEEIFVKDMSSGAQHDISQATKLARAMVCEWGMSDLGIITYDERDESGQYLGMGRSHEKNYSEETARKIDKEVYDLLEAAHKNAVSIIQDNHDKVQLMADMLVEFETLDSRDVKEILDGSWNPEEKRNRLKKAEELHKMTPPPIPKKEKNSKPSFNSGDRLQES